jgi:hypothetical protein
MGWIDDTYVLGPNRSKRGQKQGPDFDPFLAKSDVFGPFWTFLGPLFEALFQTQEAQTQIPPFCPSDLGGFGHIPGNPSGPSKRGSRFGSF